MEGYADVDAPLACRWLQERGCHTLVHGHTHKPAEHVLDGTQTPALRRLVLSDWEAARLPARGDVLRWCPESAQPWERLQVAAPNA